MEIQGQELAVNRAAWTSDAESALASAARGCIDFIRDEVQRGISVLWRITGSADGWVVTRWESEFREVVIVLGAGKNCRPAIRHFLERAREAGCSVRTHIVSPALKRIYEREGFTLAEFVMRADHGRKQQVERDNHQQSHEHRSESGR